MKKARILLVDDHTLFREGMRAILDGQADLEVVDEAGDGLEAVVKARELNPDLVLMDIQMPGVDGLEALLRIKRIVPQTVVVMLTVQNDEEKLLRAIKYGAQGYLLKDLPSSKVLELIRGALRGEAAVPPALAARVMEEFRRLSQQASALALEGHDLASLTQREQEVLTLVARGASDKEIAQALHISLYTAKSHMRNILAKLQANSRHEAARFARQMGILN